MALRWLSFLLACVLHLNNALETEKVVIAKFQLLQVEDVPTVLSPGFVSFSIEFSSFPDFAGNASSPNIFSYNLLTNLASFQGTWPVVRVGGNTQDFALYDDTLTVATNGTYTSNSQDYPSILYIGKSYFESYTTWPGVTYIHGFNLAKGNNSEGLATITKTLPLACAALKGGKLAYWELGNEPDLFKNGRGTRPKNWTEVDYVREWRNITSYIKTLHEQNCPGLPYGLIAPSFAGPKNGLDPIRTWNAGLNADGIVKLDSSHNYISGADVPGVTLQGTLMNHTSVVKSVATQTNVSSLLSNYSVPFILGETNSLYRQGRPGLSNTFGAALWGVDFNLYCASQNIQRVHMHQGTNYRYASWQPIETNKTTKGTKAPYYGNVAVAAFLGNLTAHQTSIINIPLSDDRESAYAAYVDKRLTRVIVINMMQYNYSTDATGAETGVPNNATRPSKAYSFQVEDLTSNTVPVQRLMANGSDAITGITFDGFSFNYELDNGRPVLLNNVTRGETLNVDSSGSAAVVVPYSSAVILNFS